MATLRPRPTHPNSSIDGADAAALQMSLNKGRLTNTVVTDAAGNVVASSAKADETPEAKPEPTTLTADDVTKMVNSALAAKQTEIDTALAEADKQSQLKLDALAAQAEADKKELQDKLDAAEDAKKADAIALSKLEDIFKLMGNSTAGDKDAATKQPLTIVGVGSPEMRGYESLLNGLPKKMVRDQEGGQSLQFDSRAADGYWVKNRTRISDGIEAIARDAGLLQGAGRSTDAATLPSDIPSILFTHLSALVRQSHLEDFIHWQFANTSAAPGTPAGLNTAVQRYPYQPRPKTVASRTLTPGVDITAPPRAINTLNTLITMRELGLGLDVNNAPIGIWNFTNAFSMVNLESIVERNLGVDYQAYKDVCLYSLWFGTDQIVYNNSDAVEIDPTRIVPGSNGTYTREFMINLRSRAKIGQFPTFRDGKYAFVFNTGGYGQYVAQLARDERFVSPEQKDLVTQMLQSATGSDFGGEVSGYRGTHDGFHMFEQNSYGVGAPGEVGTQTVAFGAGVGAKTCDSSFLVGADTIAWATAQPVEIVKDDIRNFGRRDSYIWHSIEAEGELDVKYNATTGTQNRVIQVRNLRAPV